MGAWIFSCLSGLAQVEILSVDPAEEVLEVVPAEVVNESGVTSSEESGEPSVEGELEVDPIAPPGPIQSLRDREARMRAVFERVAPSVVALGSAERGKMGAGWGSGVIVDESGLVLTAGHVTEATGKDVFVYLADGRRFAGERLGANMNRDASMVQIITSDDEEVLPFVEVAEPDTAELGDWVVAMGHPGGYDEMRPAPLRMGRIIQKQLQKLLVTDCTLSGGDSGGPLFDLDGRLIGIHSSIAQSLSHNVHVAIAVYHRHWGDLAGGREWGELKNLFEQPLPGYESRVDRSQNRALLGARLDKRTRNGVLVREVRPGFPAAEGGLQFGDVIMAFDGKPVSEYTELFPMLSSADPGDRVELLVDRRGQEVTVEVIMGDRAKLLGDQ